MSKDNQGELRGVVFDEINNLRIILEFRKIIEKREDYNGYLNYLIFKKYL